MQCFLSTVWVTNYSSLKKLKTLCFQSTVKIESNRFFQSKLTRAVMFKPAVKKMKTPYFQSTQKVENRSFHNYLKEWTRYANDNRRFQGYLKKIEDTIFPVQCQMWQPKHLEPRKKIEHAMVPMNCQSWQLLSTVVAFRATLKKWWNGRLSFNCRSWQQYLSDFPE